MLFSFHLRFLRPSRTFATLTQSHNIKHQMRQQQPQPQPQQQQQQRRKRQRDSFVNKMLITTSAADDAGLFLRQVALALFDALLLCHCTSNGHCAAALSRSRSCSLLISLTFVELGQVNGTNLHCCLSLALSSQRRRRRWLRLLRLSLSDVTSTATATFVQRWRLSRALLLLLLSTLRRCRCVFLGCVFEIVSIFLQLAKTRSRNSSTCVHAKRSSLVAAAAANLKIQNISSAYPLLDSTSTRSPLLTAPASPSTSTSNPNSTSRQLRPAQRACATKVKVTKKK